MTTEAPADLLRAAMARLGLTVEATFVPFSQSRNAKPGAMADGKPWLSLNWSVTVKRNGVEVLTTDYAAGSGHAPSDKADAAKIGRAARGLGCSDKDAKARLVAWECEHGRAARGVGALGLSGGAPILPDADAVVYSLVQDASVLDAGGFEDWAAELGYDTDSRKAEATYQACLEIALKLRAAIGDAGLSELREAAQDY